MSTRSQGQSTPAGRPGSSRAGQQPYPAPGSSARPGGSRAGQSTYLSPRTIARDKWSRIFGGSAYLEAGPSNRLVLSIRSWVPAEVDFALDRFLQVSGQDPELLRFVELPGLLEGLVDLIRAFLDARVEDRSSSTFGLWVDQAKETTRRRACEAALVLRNLTTDKHNVGVVSKSKKIRPLIADVLEEGALEGGEDTNELRVYLLEVLEVIAEETPLALPGQQARSNKTGAIVPITEAPTSPAFRLFPLLVALTRSADRALVIASFRCLTALSLNDTSDAALALLTYESTEPLPKPLPHPIQTAIELLPIADADLGAVVLDYIYQHTLLPANAVLFCARPDLLQILRLVCTKLHLGAKKETIEVVLPLKGSEAEEWYKTQPPRHKRNIGLSQQRELSAKLEGDEISRLAALAEPARTLNWLRTVFEAAPDAEVTQVALWQAYRSEFEPLVALKITGALLPASDVIKMSSEAFVDALPMVIEQPEKRFVIRGMRIRDRTDMRTVYICRWSGCPAPLGPSSPSTLYWHLHHTHLAASPPPPKCAWSTCTYTSPQTSPSLLTADLTLHARTHIPSYHPPPGYGNPPEPHLDSQGAIPDPPITMQHERYHAQLDENLEVTGLGFLACLVLRNVARTVKVALGNPAGGASVNSLAQGEMSIFEAIEAASEGTEQKDGVVARLEKIDFAEAKSGAEALMGLENKLVRTTVEDHGLGKILGEVLEVVTVCRKAMANREKAEENEVPMEA
ncbi:hypothetical protein BCR35DRAFT_320194 [Leucosporidium creatinivorum]|uniref:RFX-type winged-helix domain-containing protein n=1 Tax=Leucosporidium creatinivorum TaxID=106004 RepID=A0A1Y2G2V3_9BASI|nr:hypothetical protein BCR35DRAFT_320194 [Leucosporidium creatinivorum]